MRDFVAVADQRLTDKQTVDFPARGSRRLRRRCGLRSLWRWRRCFLLPAKTARAANREFPYQSPPCRYDKRMPGQAECTDRNACGGKMSCRKRAAMGLAEPPRCLTAIAREATEDASCRESRTGAQAWRSPGLASICTAANRQSERRMTSWGRVCRNIGTATVLLLDRWVLKARYSRRSTLPAWRRPENGSGRKPGNPASGADYFATDSRAVVGAGRAGANGPLPCTGCGARLSALLTQPPPIAR